MGEGRGGVRKKGTTAFWGGERGKKWQLHWCYYLYCQLFSKVNKPKWQADKLGRKGDNMVAVQAIWTTRDTPIQQANPDYTFLSSLCFLSHCSCYFMFCFACSKLLLCFWILRIILQFSLLFCSLHLLMSLFPLLLLLLFELFGVCYSYAMWAPFWHANSYALLNEP